MLTDPASQRQPRSAGRRRSFPRPTLVTLAAVFTAAVFVPAASATHTDRVYAGNWTTSYEDGDQPASFEDPLAPGTISIRWVEENEGRDAIETIGGPPPTGDLSGNVPADLSCFNREGSQYYVGTFTRASGGGGTHAGCVDNGVLESRYRFTGDSPYGEFTIRSLGSTWTGFFGYPFQGLAFEWGGTFDGHFEGDNAGEASPEATCLGKSATVTNPPADSDGVTTIQGTGGPDVIVGTNGRDSIFAGGGDDLVCGGGGNDGITGGEGHDTLLGEGDRDNVFGGDGNDRLEGGDGDDILQGGADNDLVLGQGDADQIFGDADDDILMGGGDRDRLLGAGGNDVLIDSEIPITAEQLSPLGVGPSGTGPVIPGTEPDGDDEMFGGAGVDTFFESGGNDEMFGQGDQDLFYSTDAGNDTLDGGGGFDVVSYFFATGGVKVNLNKGFGMVRGSPFPDRLQNVNFIEGSAGEDVLRGLVGKPNLILGLGGGDNIAGGRKRDLLMGGKGNDKILAGGGDDLLDGGGGRRDKGVGGPGYDICAKLETRRGCEEDRKELPTARAVSPLRSGSGLHRGGRSMSFRDGSLLATAHRPLHPTLSDLLRWSRFDSGWHQ